MLRWSGARRDYSTVNVLCVGRNISGTFARRVLFANQGRARIFFLVAYPGNDYFLSARSSESKSLLCFHFRPVLEKNLLSVLCAVRSSEMVSFLKYVYA